MNTPEVDLFENDPILTLGIDPGSAESAYAITDGKRVLRFGKSTNEFILAKLPVLLMEVQVVGIEVMTVAYARSFPGSKAPAMVGKEVMQTVYWSGRFAQVCHDHGKFPQQVSRQSSVAHLCGSEKGDAAVREQLRMVIGEHGTAAKPGPLYGVAKDIYAALCVAIYALAKTQGRTKKQVESKAKDGRKAERAAKKQNKN